MKTIMIIGLTVLFVITVPFTVLGEPKSKGVSAGYSVSNPNHTQALGGNSTHAQQGLSNAAEHSGGRVHSTVPTVTPTPKSGDTGGTTSSSGGTTGTSDGTGAPTIPSTTPVS